MSKKVHNFKSGELVEFPVISDPRGNLSFIEGGEHIPFAIERVYYLYDVPSDAERGGHCHYDLEQVIIAMSGSFDLVLDDGKEKKRIHLSSPNSGVYLGNMTWREMQNFSNDCICMVLASNKYDEADYIRCYDEFLLKVK